eukprot:1477790-Amphidinium_carterae.1
MRSPAVPTLAEGCGNNSTGFPRGWSGTKDSFGYCTLGSLAVRLSDLSYQTRSAIMALSAANTCTMTAAARASI